MDLGEKFVQFRSVVSGQGDGPVEGLSVARRVWTRVAEKKRGRGPRRRGEDHGGPSKGDRLRGSGTHTLLHRRSASCLSILLYLASASPTLSWICLYLCSRYNIPLSPRGSFPVTPPSNDDFSSQPFRPYVLLSSTSPWPTFIPISPQRIPIHPNLHTTIVPRTPNLTSSIISPPQQSCILLVSSPPLNRRPMPPQTTIRHQNLILPRTLHSRNKISSSSSSSSNNISNHSSSNSNSSSSRTTISPKRTPSPKLHF
jgi:hypothetical protein